jgi:hypothetical protein
VFSGSEPASPLWIADIPASDLRQFIVAVDVPDAGCERLASLDAEFWRLSSFGPAVNVAQSIVEFVASRGVDVVHAMGSRLGADLVPTLRAAFPSLSCSVEAADAASRDAWFDYVVARYGNLVDAFVAHDTRDRDRLLLGWVTESRIHLIEPADHAGSVAGHAQLFSQLAAASAA